MASNSDAARSAGLAARPRGAAGRPTATTVRDLLLAGLTFCSGAVDAIAFLGLGKVFTAYQTGNLVFLGLAIAGADGPPVVRPAISLACFGAAVFAATETVRPARDTRMWSARVSATLAVAWCVQVVFAIVWAATSGRPGAVSTDVLLAGSAFAMGLQSGAIMSLDVAGVFTTAATATVMFLMRDEADRTPEGAAARIRFARVLVCLVAGATVGALLLAHARAWAPLLPLAGAALVIVIASRVLEHRRARS